MGEPVVRVALIEVLDRDGSVRQSASVAEWPLRVGRALDNDLVIDDLHTAPHHFTVEPDAEGRICLRVGDSVNGLRLGAQALRGGEQQILGDEPALLALGRMQLRLRLASQPLPAEQPLAMARSLQANLSLVGGLLVAVVFVWAFGIWLEADPDIFAKALTSQAVTAVTIFFAWTGVWTLLSKVFTRQGHYAWHAQVLLLAVLAWQVADVASALIAFSLGWAWVTDFDFVLTFLIVGALLYLHLQAVEPHHPKRTRALAVSTVVMGVVLSLYFNWQNTDRPGAELYMNHLFPPALRLARPVETDAFLEGVAKLQPALDAAAKKNVGRND